jgi:hypothetical protein
VELQHKLTFDGPIGSLLAEGSGLLVLDCFESSAVLVLKIAGSVSARQAFFAIEHCLMELSASGVALIPQSSSSSFSLF